MDPLILLGSIIIVAVALTWVIPAGTYDRLPDSENGSVQVVPSSYRTVPSRPVGIGGLLLCIPQGLIKAAPVLFYVLIAGAALTVVETTGAISAILDSLVGYFGHRPSLVLLLVSLLFLVGGASYGMSEEIIAFIPLLCALMRRMHLPNTMGVAVSLGSASVASAFSPFNTFILGISQPTVGLPLFSGFTFRSIVFAIAISAWLAYLLWQAHRIRTTEAVGVQGTLEDATRGLPLKISGQHYVVLAILNGGMAMMVVGAIIWSWDLTQFCGVLIATGLLAGLAGGLKLRGTSEAFGEGLRRVALAAFLVGVARAISVVLEQGMILDTITELLFRPLQHIPRAATGVMMLASQSLLGLPMPSDSGKAMLTLPILSPLADLLHISRQVVVLSYQYGNVIADSMTPTFGALLAMLTIAQVSFKKWLRFMLPIFLILFAISAIAITIAVHIGLK
jgi:uncharacterized ion transporter superfamily protein YfcC